MLVAFNKNVRGQFHPNFNLYHACIITTYIGEVIGRRYSDMDNTDNVFGEASVGQRWGEIIHYKTLLSLLITELEVIIIHHHDSMKLRLIKKKLWSSSRGISLVANYKSLVLEEDKQEVGDLPGIINYARYDLLLCST